MARNILGKQNASVSSPNRSKLKKKLEPLVKEYVKIRDNYTCQRCGKQVEGVNCHASHILPVGAYSILQFEPLNMKVLCYHCHLNFWHKNPLEANKWFQDKFPDRWKQLQALSISSQKIPTYQLQEMIDEYKVKLLTYRAECASIEDI